MTSRAAARGQRATAGELLSDGAAWLGSRVAPVRLPVAAVGLVLVLVGVNTPWATYSGFPGLMTLYFYPAGAKAYCLVLAAAFVLFVVPLAGRRRATLSALGGLTVVALVTVFAIADRGGGLVNVAFGAWLTVAGGVVGFVAALGLPADVAPGPWRRLPAPVEWALLVAGYVLLLWLTVYGLDTSDSTQFVALSVTVGAAAVALVALGVLSGFSRLSDRHRAVSTLAFLGVLLAFPFTQGGADYWLRVAASVGVFAAAAIGLNIVVGLAGLLDLGYVAFFGVGAYTAALLSGSPNSPVDLYAPFWLVFFLGAALAALFGVLIGAPTLRLRGDYLAIVTLGFGEIFRIVVQNNPGGKTGGPNGVFGIPQLDIGDFNFGEPHTVFGVELSSFANYYYLELILVAVVMVVFSRLNDSRIGRAWVAIREDETAAQAMGVNTVEMKLLAFATGAFIAGAAGTVNAHLGTQVSPDSYTFLQSVLLLAAVVLGGMGTIAGAVVGSALLIVIPEKLRAFQDYRLLLFGLALILMMRFRPEGMIPNRRRRREFHEAEGHPELASDEAPMSRQW